MSDWVNDGWVDITVSWLLGNCLHKWVSELLKELIHTRCCDAIRNVFNDWILVLTMLAALTLQRKIRIKVPVHYGKRSWAQPRWLNAWRLHGQSVCKRVLYRAFQGKSNNPIANSVEQEGPRRFAPCSESNAESSCSRAGVVTATKRKNR